MYRYRLILLVVIVMSGAQATWIDRINQAAHAVGQTMTTTVIPSVKKNSKVAALYTYNKLAQAGRFTAGKIGSVCNKISKQHETHKSKRLKNKTKKIGAPRRS